jgi:serine/threonine protein kinase
MTKTQKKAPEEKPQDDKLKISADKVPEFSCMSCGESISTEGVAIFGRTTCGACSTEQDAPGRIGDFLIYKVLGRGAISVVFKARDRRNDRLLALKVSHKLGRKPTEFYDDYLSEAKATTFINHENIINVYDYGFTNQYPYIAMEMILGGTLKEMIKNDLFLGERKVMKLAHDISSGLHAAYLAGIIHGDLKPANILNHEDRIFKIADFGNFNTKGTSSEDNIKIFGTPYYIAPEKVQHKKEDVRSDIYSLGATLWHALSGYPPHDGKDVKEVVRAHINEQSPDLKHANPTVSDDTAALIRKMMASSPEKRFQNYPELIEAIEETQKKLEQRAAEKAQV